MTLYENFLSELEIKLYNSEKNYGGGIILNQERGAV